MCFAKLYTSGEVKNQRVHFSPDICGAKAPLCATDPKGAAFEQEETAGNHARDVPRLRRHVCLGE